MDRLGVGRPRSPVVHGERAAVPPRPPGVPPSPLVRGPGSHGESATSHGSPRPATRCPTQDWAAGFAKSLMVFMNGKLPNRGPRGQQIIDDTFLLCFNAHFEPLAFTLPPEVFGGGWRRVIDTADSEFASARGRPRGGATLEVLRSVVVLRLAEPARVEAGRPGRRRRPAPDGIALAQAWREDMEREGMERDMTNQSPRSLVCILRRVRCISVRKRSERRGSGKPTSRCSIPTGRFGSVSPSRTRAAKPGNRSERSRAWRGRYDRAGRWAVHGRRTDSGHACGRGRELLASLRSLGIPVPRWSFEHRLATWTPPVGACDDQDGAACARRILLETGPCERGTATGSR